MLYKARFRQANAKYVYTGMIPDKELENMVDMAGNIKEYNASFKDDAYVMKLPDGKIYLVEKKVFEALFEVEE